MERALFAMFLGNMRIKSAAAPNIHWKAQWQVSNVAGFHFFLPKQDIEPCLVVFKRINPLAALGHLVNLENTFCKSNSMASLLSFLANPR